jgi:DNA replication protein DnaC
MLINQTLEHLRNLKLAAMAAALEEQMQQPLTFDLSFEERFSLLVMREITDRENRRLQRLLKTARLKQPACVEDIDYRHPRGLDKSLMATLAGGDWIRRGANVHLTGQTGTGKSWLACALGNQACRMGWSVKYERVPRLLENLRIAHADGSFGKRLAQLAKTDLLILDDFGIKPLARGDRHDLLEIIEDRHGARSTLVTSQLPISLWHEYIGEPTVADAVLDRLLQNAFRMELKGESLRRTKTNLTDAVVE